MHVHGALGLEKPEGSEIRAAHCHSGSRSPLIGKSYELQVSGEGKSESDALPSCPMTNSVKRSGSDTRKRRALFRQLDQHFKPLLEAMLSAIIGQRIGAMHSDVKLPDESRLQLLAGGAAWFIRDDGRELQRGEGVITLTAALYGIPAGIAARRILEAVTNTCFDPATAGALETLIDTWAEQNKSNNQVRR